MIPSQANPRPDLYTILDLPWTGPRTGFTQRQLKAAYHRALLRHHPDKIQVSRTTGTSSSTPETDSRSNVHGERTQNLPDHDSLPQQHPQRRLYTIDQIALAYRTLSDEKLRREYDRCIFSLEHFRCGQDCDDDHNGPSGALGLDVIDLGDFSCVEGGLFPSMDCGRFGDWEEERGLVYWYRGCRCGDEKGYLITEDELEENVDGGEIVVGCRGCSLWVRVLFREDPTPSQKDDLGDNPRHQHDSHGG